MRTYLTVMVAGNFVWKAMQFPLYTIWTEGSRSHLVLAMFHGTEGGEFIAACAPTAGLALFSHGNWPAATILKAAIPTPSAESGYTFSNERVTVEVRHVRAHSDLMPCLPRIGAGLAPVPQWLIAHAIAYPSSRSARACRFVLASVNDRTACCTQALFIMMALPAGR